MKGNFNMSFDQWMKIVDSAIYAKTGMSYMDLPDVCYRDWYDADVTPKGAASRAIKSAKDEGDY
jgi:hypothetical protein